MSIWSATWKDHSAWSPSWSNSHYSDIWAQVGLSQCNFVCAQSQLKISLQQITMEYLAKFSWKKLFCQQTDRQDGDSKTVVRGERRCKVNMRILLSEEKWKLSVDPLIQFLEKLQEADIRKWNFIFPFIINNSVVYFCSFIWLFQMKFYNIKKRILKLKLTLEFLMYWRLERIYKINNKDNCQELEEELRKELVRTLNNFFICLSVELNKRVGLNRYWFLLHIFYLK